MRPAKVFDPKLQNFNKQQVQVADFIAKDPTLQRHSAPSRERVVEMLTSVGFSQELQGSPVVSLSGGWKMKLALGAFNLPA